LFEYIESPTLTLSLEEREADAQRVRVRETIARYTEREVDSCNGGHGPPYVFPED